MGAVKGFIDSFDDSDKLQQAAKANLQDLAAYANEKAKAIKDEIYQSIVSADSTDNPPRNLDQYKGAIDNIIQQDNETHAYHSDNADSIKDAVSDVLSGLLNQEGDELKTGAQKVVTSAIDALFGSTSAGEDTTELYFLARDNFTVVRIDLKAWKREVSSTSLREKVELVSAFGYTKSVVNAKKLGRDTLRNEFTPLITATYPDLEPKESLAKLDEFIDQLLVEDKPTDKPADKPKQKEPAQ
ncbi:hypothetical protein BCU61_010385 [Vibrio splendidus]|uniref:hypothetical protein n=1 Tax=Vibrio TaxID=662 RepID=UPI000978B271|nr:MULTISPECIES: hypothetical protein [Vibrio]OMO28677.1 hypothetical protein BH583_00935 [Vibrio lentus]PMH66866.1 hypothetical protein BCU61_03805 [Vibrio splendidus]